MVASLISHSHFLSLLYPLIRAPTPQLVRETLDPSLNATLDESEKDYYLFWRSLLQAWNLGRPEAQCFLYYQPKHRSGQAGSKAAVIETSLHVV